MDYTKFITIEPNKRGGRPCIRGTRISVYDIAGWFASGMNEGEIIKDFPELTSEDIRAAMAFLAQGNVPSKSTPRTPKNAQQRAEDAEKYIAKLVSGTRGSRRSAYDVTSANGIRLEVKYSRLSKLKGGRRTTRSWDWFALLGQKHDKEYDRLILAGVPNPEFANVYAELEGQYVLFDVPFAEVVSVMTGNSISLNSNPEAVRKSHKYSRLFGEFHITSKQLIMRYGKL